MQTGVMENKKDSEIHELHPILQKMRVHPVAPDSQEGFFTTHSGDQLFYRKWVPVNPKQIVVAVHGMVAHNDYLVLVADQVIEKGVGLYALDLKHHGYSSGPKGDLEDFEEVIAQLHEFVENVKREIPELPVYILGISMGGAIVIHYHLLFSKDCAGLILMAPAVKTRVKISVRDAVVFPYLVLAFLLFRGKPVVNLAKRQAGGLGTQNPLRIEWDADNPLRIKKISVRYLLNVNKWVKQAFRHAKDISCPIIICQGTDDKIVSPGGVKQFFDQLTTPDRTLVSLEGAYHSLFSDPVMEDRGYAQLRAWLEKHEPHKKTE